MALSITTKSTTPFDGQKPGTSGLRKAVKVFQQENYTENFVQCILDSAQAEGHTLVVGGDGRFYCPEVVDIIIKMAAANGVKGLIVGQHGIFSTPCLSGIVRERGVCGGILLTASHNPGGPDADFGIKYNCSNGGPAPDQVTNAMYDLSCKITEYRICPDIQCDINTTGTYHYEIEKYGQFTVEVVDSVDAYVKLMKDIFDFPAIADFLKDFPVLMDGLNGVTGPYIERIFLSEFQVPEDNVRNSKPLPDFGGLHPDPNLTYAKALVDTVTANHKYKLGAAFDGDGDRNMILGQKGLFVTPCDSVAIIADNSDCIPYFSKHGGVKGLARSMPTSCAIDLVAAARKVEMFEVPTGWKYFGNLMDAGRLSICGEESFGTGSDHIREKDGIWAALAWLSILAQRRCSVEELLVKHWSTYGRNFFTRYDYENCDSEQCNQMIEELRGQLDDASGSLKGRSFENGGKTYTVAKADDFSYIDPIDGSVATKQGVRLIMTDGSRIIYRLSGTGSSGATVRLYVESYEKFEAGSEDKYLQDCQVVLKPLLGIALEVAKLPQFTGRNAPTVIT
uniref:phosphoglucomutase (alpha-D-glucose-1,6-bisphosphate-dependent) n=1 Tax=Hirondellea gigas TaxID=1518452 RepID=A0A2P2HXS4_9CRUS